MSDAIQDEDEYKKRLHAWTEGLNKHESARIEGYIGGRIVSLVDDLQNAAVTVGKFNKIPVLQEKKRNMWSMNDIITKPIDWARVKRARHSLQHPMKSPVDEDQLDTMIEVYSRMKTVADDSFSDDIVAVIACGPEPNQFTNKNAEIVSKKLKAMTPKHQSPKIGNIEVHPTDIISRIQRVKSSFVAKLPDLFVFTKHRKGSISRKQMTHLQGGDTYFNKWPVQAVPFAQIPRCTVAQHDLLFKRPGEDVETSTFIEDEDLPMVEMDANEAALPEDEVLPFYHEPHHKLGQEFLNVFELDTIVDFAPAGGNMMKAVLVENSRPEP